MQFTGHYQIISDPRKTSSLHTESWRSLPASLVPKPLPSSSSSSSSSSAFVLKLDNNTSIFYSVNGHLRLYPIFLLPRPKTAVEDGQKNEWFVEITFYGQDSVYYACSQALAYISIPSEFCQEYALHSVEDRSLQLAIDQQSDGASPHFADDNEELMRIYLPEASTASSFLEESFWQSSITYTSGILRALERTEWTLTGPPSLQRLYTPITTLPASNKQPIMPLLDSFKSTRFHKWLQTASGLPLGNLQCMHVRRLGCGDHLIVNDEHVDPLGLDVIINITDGLKSNGESGGSLHYVVDDEVVASVLPIPSISLAYREDAGMRVFCERISGDHSPPAAVLYQIAMTWRVLDDEE